MFYSSLLTGSCAFTAGRMCSLNLINASCQSVNLSVAVKKEEDIGLQIKEENLRDGHSGEIHPVRGVKENSDKKGDKETSRGDDSSGDGSREVRKAQRFSSAGLLLAQYETHSNLV